MSNEIAINELLQVFSRHRSFFITSHARPDGDALGSALGLMHLLDALGGKVTVAFADPVPNAYRTLPGVDRIVHQLPCTAPDVAIVLECDSIERTGFCCEAFANMGAGMLINIDHHRSARTFGDINWINENACAVGSMVYELIIGAGMAISEPMATCLYTAVLTDTGSFTHAGTIASTFALAEHLIQSGADPNRIAQDIYFSNSPGKVRLLGTALTNMQIDGEVAWSVITEAEMERAGAIVEDCEGVVNYLIGISGVVAAAFLREIPGPDTAFRLSLRSKGDVDVAEVAEKLGGGGHRNASGCTIPGPADRAARDIVAALHAVCPSGRPTLLA